MFRQIFAGTDNIYQEDFHKLVVLKRSTKGAMHLFVERLVLNLLSAKIRKNAMLRQFV